MNKEKQSEFLALYEPIHERFERFCRARVYGDMDYRDLMNETLLRAYQNFDTLRSKEAFLAFLFSISVRVLANNNRKKKERAIDLGDGTVQIQDNHQNTSSSTEVYMLHKAMAQLPEAQRECIILFEISGFNMKEIAAIQETSLSNVKQRLRRGRLKLKDILTFVATHTSSDVTESISEKGKNYE